MLPVINLKFIIFKEETRMKLNKMLLTAALATAMVFGTVGCTSKTEVEKPKDEAAAPLTNGELVMATNAEFPPYEYHGKDENGKDAVIGIDVEIARAVAAQMGKTLKVEDMNFDSIITAVNSGKADFGAAGMTVTEERLKNVDFSDTYITASQVIIVKKDSTDVKGPDDLVNKKIGVQLGTTGDIYSSEIEGATVERYNKGFEAVQAVQQGKIDAVVIDSEPAKAFAKQNTDVVVLEEPFTDEEYAFAVKKGNTELTEQINSAIAELKESGKLQEIFDKYISAE